MTPRALSFVAVALLAVGASALPFLRSWRLPATGTSTLVAVSEEPDDKVRVRLFGENAQTFRYADFTRQEAAELGRALLEAAGETEKPGMTLDQINWLYGKDDSACGLLKRYIAIREKQLADPEISEFYRKVHENEITALRTKIQEKALDGWCR